jgi:hypothetical protein
LIISTIEINAGYLAAKVSVPLAASPN